MTSDSYDQIIVDDNDKVIGYKPRSTLAADDIYRVSALWLTNSKGDILLAQRKFTKKHSPGKWGPAVAGTVEKGETYESNIIKETSEEIGLTGVQFEAGPERRTDGKYHYFCQWFRAGVDKDAADFTIQEDEVEQVKWFEPDELARDVREHPEKYITGFGKAVENL